eukprot:9503538-Pyramimonas_sp.AAC.1
MIVYNIEDGFDWKRNCIREDAKGSYHYDEEKSVHQSYKVVTTPGEKNRSIKRKSSNDETYPSAKMPRRIGFEDEPTETGYDGEEYDWPEVVADCWIPLISFPLSATWLDDDHDHGGVPVMTSMPVSYTDDRNGYNSTDDEAADEREPGDQTPWSVAETAEPPPNRDCDYSTTTNNEHEGNPSPYGNENDDLCVDQSHFVDLIEYGVREFGSTIEEVAEVLTKLGHPTGKTKAKSLKDRCCPYAFQYSRQLGKIWKAIESRRLLRRQVTTEEQDARTLVEEEAKTDKLLDDKKAQVLKAFERAKRHFKQTNNNMDTVKFITEADGEEDVKLSKKLFQRSYKVSGGMVDGGRAFRRQHLSIALAWWQSGYCYYATYCDRIITDDTHTNRDTVAKKKQSQARRARETRCSRKGVRRAERGPETQMARQIQAHAALQPTLQRYSAVRADYCLVTKNEGTPVGVAWSTGHKPRAGQLGGPASRGLFTNY